MTLLAILLIWPAAARAYTPCPTVTDWVSILQVFLTGTPYPLANAQYDLKTKYLWVLFTNNVAHFYINVPLSQVQGQPKWATVSRNHEALVQQGTWCPILLSSGLPLVTR